MGSGQLVTGVGMEVDRELAPSVGGHRVVPTYECCEMCLVTPMQGNYGVITVVGIKQPHSALKLIPGSRIQFLHGRLVTTVGLVDWS